MRKAFALFCAAALTLLFAGCGETPEEQGNKGVLCYGSGNYPEAVKWFQKAAEQGYAEAQNNLGVCYMNGIGVSKNNDEAVKWFRQAARQGHAYARKTLKQAGINW